MIRNRVNHLQSNRLGLSLLASDALVVSLDGLLAGEVSLAGITLVDQELHIHLAGWGDMNVNGISRHNPNTYTQSALVAFAQRALDAIAMGLLVLVVICVVLGLGHLKLLRISKDSKMDMKTE